MLFTREHHIEQIAAMCADQEVSRTPFGSRLTPEDCRIGQGIFGRKRSEEGDGEGAFLNFATLTFDLFHPPLSRRLSPMTPSPP